MSTNCTNITTSSPSGLEIIVFPILYIILCVFICGGNMLTIVAVCKTEVLRTIPNMFVVSLAIADLMIGGLVIPMQFLLYMPTLMDILDHSRIYCIFKYVTFTTSGTASVYFLMATAFDRAIYIGYSIHYETIMSTFRAKVVILVGWLISLNAGFIPAYYNNWDSCPICHAFIFLKMEFQVYIQCVAFFICFIIISVCYATILKIAAKQQKEILRLQIQEAKKMFEIEMKLVRMFMLVFGIFAICWTPNMIVLILKHLTNSVPRMMIHIVTPLCLLNSGMNFIVYAVKNPDFRRTFYKLMGFKNGRNSRITPIINSPR
ncbi:hypothetical protein SNE40_017390 [Patella caerulea]|uniref:G-protein coupled receptors family 1 profile domain-containing protein n=1 Tax=Patella caerulea TaxID=87958 RepID=A0AAN8PE19_PATCE